MTKDLFFAILAMDAYNRGYTPGLTLDPNVTQVGAADIGDNSSILGLAGDGVPIDESVSFFAQAYTWNGQSVILYRGTDNYNAVDGNNDIYNGWPIAAGSYSAPQAELASPVLSIESLWGGAAPRLLDETVIVG